MTHNVLITGCSGYLGGTLLASLKSADLPACNTLYGLVRTKEQAEAVKQYGAEPLTLDLQNEERVIKTIVDNKITIIYYLIGVTESEVQVRLIKALAEVKKATGHSVHFLHTSGAKVFSSHAGLPVDRPLYDTDPDLYDIQKNTQAPFPIMGKAVNVNKTIIDTAEACGVRSYIFIPCIVYGKGEGFGNPISIQTRAIVQAAVKIRQVYKVGPDTNTWPVCHVRDNAALYIHILRDILLAKDIGCNKEGYYLASPGSVAWSDIYKTMATQLKKSNIVDHDNVGLADDEALQKMGDALGCPKGVVPVQLGGKCMLQAKRGSTLGWKPQYTAEHILENASEEVQLILQNIKT